MIGFIYRPGLHPQQGDKVVQEVGVFHQQGTDEMGGMEVPENKALGGGGAVVALAHLQGEQGRFHARYPITAVEEAHGGS